MDDMKKQQALTDEEISDIVADATITANLSPRFALDYAVSLNAFARAILSHAAPAGAVALDQSEQYRMQMAGISTAAFGYWKEGDDIHPDYDTVALRDVARLYAKYAELRAALTPASTPELPRQQARVPESTHGGPDLGEARESQKE